MSGPGTSFHSSGQVSGYRFKIRTPGVFLCAITMPFVFDPFRFRSLHSEDAQADPLAHLSTLIPEKKDRDRDLVRFLTFENDRLDLESNIWFCLQVMGAMLSR